MSVSKAAEEAKESFDIFEAAIQADEDGFIYVLSAWPSAEARHGVISQAVAESPDVDPAGIARLVIQRARDTYEAKIKAGAETGGDDTHCVTPVAGDVTQTHSNTGDSGDTGDPTRSNETQRRREGEKSENSELNDNSRQQALNEWLAKTVALPFGDFLRETYRYAGLQTRAQGWGDPMFHFVWLLRGHADMEPLLENPRAALKQVETIFKHWSDYRHQRGESTPYGTLTPGDFWFEWFGVQRVEARATFDHLWRTLRYRPGHGPLEQAIAAATQNPLELPNDVAAKRPPEDPEDWDKSYRFFVSVAGYLQVAMGDKPICLPCRKLADLLGISPMTISRYIRSAIEDGFIVQTAEAAFRSKGGSKAAEFRFDIGRWPILAKRGSGEGRAVVFDQVKAEIDQLAGQSSRKLAAYVHSGTGLDAGMTQNPSETPKRARSDVCPPAGDSDLFASESAYGLPDAGRKGDA